MKGLHGWWRVSAFEVLTYRLVSMEYNWWILISRISAQDRRVGDILIVQLNSKDVLNFKSCCAEGWQCRRIRATNLGNPSMMLKLKKPQVSESDLRHSLVKRPSHSICFFRTPQAYVVSLRFHVGLDGIVENTMKERSREDIYPVENRSRLAWGQDVHVPSRT